MLNHPYKRKNSYPSFASAWMVFEAFWNEVLKEEGYPKNPTRTQHPGLVCLDLEKEKGLHANFFILYGSSKNPFKPYDCFVIKSLRPDKNGQLDMIPTFFGAFSPKPIGFVEWDREKGNRKIKRHSSLDAEPSEFREFLHNFKKIKKVTNW